MSFWVFWLIKKVIFRENLGAAIKLFFPKGKKGKFFKENKKSCAFRKTCNLLGKYLITILGFSGLLNKLFVGFSFIIYFNNPRREKEVKKDSKSNRKIILHWIIHRMTDLSGCHRNINDWWILCFCYFYGKNCFLFFITYFFIEGSNWISVDSMQLMLAWNLFVYLLLTKIDK